jgi:photosystem II stability/assembly factor-like uncharacterized protein
MKLTVIALLCMFLPAFAEGPRLKWQPLNEPGCGGWLTSLAVDPTDSRHLLLGGDMLGVGASHDGGLKWETVSGFPSYEIANFTFNPKNPSQVWVGTMSGPLVSQDGGATWELRREGLPPVSGNFYSAPIQQIFIDPANDQRLLAFGGSWRGWTPSKETKFGWIWESLDGGKSWHEYSVLEPHRNIRWVAAAAGGLNTLYASVKGEGLSKSVDGGKTWTALTNGLPSTNINQIATHPTDPNIVWVSLGNFKPEGTSEFQPGGIWKSQDAGKTWNACNNGLPQKSGTNEHFASRFEPLTVSPSQPNVLYTSDTAWDAPAMYRSDDDGGSWHPIFTRDTHKLTPTAYPAGLGATVITVDPKDPNVVYGAGPETVVKSSDGGKTWQDITAEHVDHPAAPSVAFFKGRGYSGLCSIAVRFNPYNPNVSAFIAMDAGRLWISEDQQKTWRYCDNGFPWSWGGGRDVAFAGKDGKTMLGAFGQDGIAGNIGLSADAGYTWRMLGVPGSGLPPIDKGSPTGVYLLPDNTDEMWAVDDGELYHSDNGGKIWVVLLKGKFGRIVADPKNPESFYLTGKDGVQKTTDGQHFSPLPDGPKPVISLVVDHQHPQVLYATQGYKYGGNIWKFDGKSWSKIFENNLVSGLAIDPTDGNRIAASTNRDPYRDVCDATGAWLSADGGKTWSNQTDGLACLRGWGIDINPNDPEEIYFCSQGRGFFVARWPKSASP